MAFRNSTSVAYQPCDTYFVEEQNTSYKPYNPKEHAKLQARRRQDDMASELSRLTSDEYLDDILRHMEHMENETTPDVSSIDIQEEIQWFMRPFLLDFLIDSHAFFQLLPETLFLAINLLDRYCSKRVVYKRHYQLVGCASLLVAAKYGDRKERVPTIGELRTMCCSLYDADMFTQMEWHVLNTLDWNIGAPTVDSFLQIAMQEHMDYDDVEVEHMAWYICEMALYHKEFVSTKPSVMARASLALARGILGRHEITDRKWGHAESLTLLNLSNQIHQPSPTLSRKYSTPAMSRTSGRLQQFLAEQAAIARNNNAFPPSPPCEPDHQKGIYNAQVYSTPQKAMCPTMAHGYMTPPITPEGEYFQGGSDKGYPPRRPITPSPSGHGHYTQQQQVQQSYQQYY